MMRSISEYLDLPYTYIVKKEPDGSYFISVKELPGCMSVGVDVPDAYAMIRDAMETWISYSLEDGMQIPEPEEDNLDEYSGKFVVRITPTLHKKLAEGAKKNGVSMNHYTSELLSERCSTIENYEKFNSQLISLITNCQISVEENEIAGKKYKFYEPSNMKWEQVNTKSRGLKGFMNCSVLFDCNSKNKTEI